MTALSEPVEIAGLLPRRTPWESTNTAEALTTAMSDPVESVLARLQAAGCGPKPVALDSWRSLCPAHGDSNPSLSVSRGDDGRALIHCFGGCKYADLLSALGMVPSDLFIRRPGGASRPRGSSASSIEQVVWQYVPRIGCDPQFWTYQDALGDEILTVARYRAKAGHKEIRPFRRGENGSWRLGRPPGKLPLYRLGEVTSAEAVVVVEGEKCADLARRMGHCVTTSAFGAGSAIRTDWSPLAGKYVIMVPDEDEAGRRYAREVARAVADLSPPASFKVLRLPGLTQGEDIEQWLDRQTGGIEGARAAFDELVRNLAVPPVDLVRPSELARAAAFLARQTAAGPVPSKVVEERAEQAGISKRTLARAKGPAGVESRRLPGLRGWSYCRLGLDPSRSDCQCHDPETPDKDAKDATKDANRKKS